MPAVHGDKHGIIRGPTHGIGRGVSMAGVTRDATSGIYCPANATEWVTTMSTAGLATGSPSAVYNCQETSGNLADSVGTFTLTAVNTPLYRQAVAGWSRLAVSATDGGTQNFDNVSASLPDPAAASMLVLAYMIFPSAPATIRAVARLAVTTVGDARITNTPRPEIVVGATTVNGTADPTGAVRPWVLKHNFTGSAQALYTNQEKIVPTFTALSGKSLHFFRTAAALSPAGSLLYAAAFFAGAAELTDAQVKTLLQTLGWTIPWT